MSEELNRKLAALIKLSELKEQEIQSIARKEFELYGFVPQDSPKTAKLNNELYSLYRQIDQVTNELNSLKFRNKDATTSNGLIDLYKCDEEDNPKGNYYVCLHNHRKIIGEIGCNLECNNVHYSIDGEFQGQGYGFQALLLLVEHLSAQNIETISLLIDEDNIASISLAEKLKNYYPSVQVESKLHCVSYHFDIKRELSHSETTSIKNR